MQGKIRGFLHLYIGQEAVAVGAMSSLKIDDYVVSHYRDHGHALARGMDPNVAMAELYGKVTNFPFAMIYPEIDFQPRHPSQLYEAFLEGIILFIILFTYFNKTKSDPTIGKISGLFLILYSIFRILIEFLREPDSHIGLIFNIVSMGQILSIPLLIIGIMFFKKL